MEAVAGDHLGLSVTSGQVEYLLNKLYNDRTNRGLLVHYHLADAQRAVMECRYRADDFFAALQDWLASQGGGTGRVRRPEVVPNPVSEGLAHLASLLRGRCDPSNEPEDRQDFIAARDRLLALADAIEDWRMQRIAEAVYWIDVTSGRHRRRTTLAAAPIDVGPALREHLFEKVPTVIMTSATLATGGSFHFFQSRVGLTQARDPDPGQPLRLPAAGPVDPLRRHARSGNRRLRLSTGGDRDDPPLCGPQRRPGVCALHQLRDDAAVRRPPWRLGWPSRTWRLTVRPTACLAAKCSSSSRVILARCCSARTVFGRGWTCRATP